jgi:cobalamin biosynthesis protein CobD/CbiB
MSAMAGLLCVKLEKPGHYSLGDDCSPLSPMHIQKALHVMYVSTLLFVLLIAVPIMLFSTWLASFT